MARPKVSDILRARINHLFFVSGRKQVEMADYLHVSETRITQMLKGDRAIHVNDLDRIAQFFGMSVADLFMIDGEKFRERRVGPRDRRSRKDRRSGLDRRGS